MQNYYDKYLKDLLFTLLLLLGVAGTVYWFESDELGLWRIFLLAPLVFWAVWLETRLKALKRPAKGNVSVTVSDWSDGDSNTQNIFVDNASKEDATEIAERLIKLYKHDWPQS